MTSKLAALEAQVHAWNGYADNSGTKPWQAMPDPRGWQPAAYCGKGGAVIRYAAGIGPGPLKTWANFPYCPNGVNAGTASGRRITSYGSKRGDIAYMDWANSAGRRDGSADHFTTIWNNNPNYNYVDTFEFNTVDGKGGTVRGAFFRRRLRADILCCINYQPELTGNSSAPTPAPVTNAHPNQDLGKYLDEKHRKLLQKVLRVAQDGVIGKDTIGALQTVLGTPEDGVLTGGYSSAVATLQRVINVHVDGVVGPETGEALAAYLDAGHTFGHAPVKSTASKFPLPKGQVYAMNDGTNLTHSGVRGNDHVVVQRIQKKLGGIAVDGAFGKDTKAKVVAFQKAHKLSADGQVGPKTWAALGL